MAPASSSPQRLGCYELIEPIGGGAMATVYKARHTETGAVVAVKIMPQDLARHPIMLKRFEQEFRVASKLDHPNVVRALDFCGTDPTPYLVMEYVAGQSLGQKLDDDGRLPEEDALRIIVQVAHGLHRAHRQGLIHRDIKPDNILVTPDGKVKLTDLGLAKDTDGSGEMTRTGRGLGTPNYMAPEQFSNAKNASVRCDIYSLGATLYQMVTGEVPFDGVDAIQMMMRKMNNDFPPPRRLVSGLSERTEKVITRAMSAHPEQRPASCREFVEELLGQSTRATVPTSDSGGSDSDFWYVVYMDGAGETRTAKGNSQVIRKSLAEGSLGDEEQVRISRRPAGPFEPLRHFREFRDPATVWAARREGVSVPLVAEPEPAGGAPTPPSRSMTDTHPAHERPDTAPALPVGPSGSAQQVQQGNESPGVQAVPEEQNVLEWWKVALLVLVTVVVVGAIGLVLLP